MAQHSDLTGLWTGRYCYAVPCVPGVEFAKSYDSAGSHAHRVDYVGTIREDL